MTNPAYEATNSDVEKLKPGKYAILYRDNWDGEGDTYHCLADLDVDGRWLSDETGKQLLEYVGDEILKAWPLVDGADVIQSAPNGMMQLSNELAEMKPVKLPSRFFHVTVAETIAVLRESQVIEAITEAGGQVHSTCPRCKRTLDLTHKPNGEHYCHVVEGSK